MVLAVAQNKAERFDLKTLEGGYVEIRRMNQGEKMDRQARMSGMKVLARKGSKDFEGELALANRRVTEYEFATCIVDHNLEKEEGVKLNLGNSAELAILDGKVGEEIGVYIDRVNQFTDDDEAGE